MSKIAVIGIASNPSTAGFSHNGGWTGVILSQISSRFGCNSTIDIVKDPVKIHDYDVVVINEGINYKKGSWNFFGGMQPRSLEVIDNLVNYEGRVYSFNEEICWESLLKRKELREAGYEVSDFPEVTTISTDYGPRRIIGDSHSVSIHRDGYGISRNDGKTLFGALKEGSLLDLYNFNGVSHVELYFGNIDVRFHLMRQEAPLLATWKLCKKYTEFAVGLANQGKHVTIQGLLPIEDESRKIPKTGQYNGQNFFGTREERQELVDCFNITMERKCEEHGIEFRQWDLPVPLPFEAMEARQSVHLRPDCYYFQAKQDLFR